MPSTPALQLARSAYDDRAWGDAFTGLHHVDGDQALAPADLERLAVAAWFTGHDAATIEALERLHHRCLDEHDIPGAVRAAVWLAILHFLRGQSSQGGGWMARTGRLVDQLPARAAARGLAMVPPAVVALESGDPSEGLTRFREIADIAADADDADLVVFALLGQGRALVMLGQAEAGLELLDEAMVAATTDDVLPVLVGIVYCAVILACRAVFDLRRAQEWTAVLSRWCTDQQDLKPYRGQCLVHRSEIMQFRGEWSAARAEVDAARAHMATVPGDPAIGMAHYRHAELARLSGALDEAEASYRLAGELGHPLHPGLALLRLAQGRMDDAATAIRRVLGETEGDRVRRSAVLAAHVEIMLAIGMVEDARVGVDELWAIAADFDSAWLQAQAATCQGAVALAADDAGAARTALNRAWRLWHQLHAPFEAARTRVLMARALRTLGDDDSAAMELAAARRVFEDLGAMPSLREVSRLTATAGAAAPGGLTPRELEVVGLVATGATNRAVADELVISEKTVARHLSNIYTKLDLSSRAAATAWAYEHDLV